MKLILLGTGTSTGIPEVGCSCMLCRSENPRDKRLRTSALLISNEGKRILIDCGPDFRQQANHIGLDHIDAIVITHEHYDHVYGLDDLRTIAWASEIPIYGQSHVLDAIKKRMHYVFSDNPYPGTPKFKLCPIQETAPLIIHDIRITPLVVMHGKLPILAYRFHQEGTKTSDDISYITDMKTISQHELSKVNDSNILVINALRYRKEHPSHQSIEDVLHLLDSFNSRPKLAVLTHLSHHAPCHTELVNRLSKYDVVPGYDYACLSISGSKASIKDFQPTQPIEYSGLCNKIGGNRNTISITKVDTDSCLDVCITYTKSDLQEQKNNFNLELDKAISKLAQFQRITVDEMHTCIYNTSITNTPHTLIQKCSLSINNNEHCKQCIQDYSKSDERLDITVIQHLLSAFIYKELKAILADDHQGSLHPIND